MAYHTEHGGAGARDGAVRLAAAPSRWDGTPVNQGQAEFRILAKASPQLLMRIFGLFAQQDRMPDRATVEVAKGALEIVLAADDFSRHRAEVVAEKIRSLVGSHSVDLVWRP